MVWPAPHPLTDRTVRTVAPRQTPIDVRDTHTRGLILTVLPSGRRQFTLRYRYQGKHRRLILGDYPQLTLAQARRRARQQQVAIADGGDPVGDRRMAKAAPTDTVAALAADYLAKHARPFKKSAAEDERILRVNVLPHWGTRSVRDLTRRDVRALLEPIAARAPVMANRTLACIRTMLNFAIDRDWIEANPAARVRKPAPEVSRDRVLDDDEIRRIWRTLSHVPATAQRPAPGQHAETSPNDDSVCPISAAHAALLKIRILTAQRGGEVARMRWRDLDLETSWWTIPGTVTKNGESHRVPLVDEARTIIGVLGSDRRDSAEYVFSGRGDASVLDRAKKAPAVVARALKIDFRGHDLRRTAATRMAAAGVPRDHIARVLNHVAGGARATRVYDRHQYDHEKRLALEAWARALTAILTRRSTDTVVPFGRQ